MNSIIEGQNYNKKQPFGDFTQKSNPSDYWLGQQQQSPQQPQPIQQSSQTPNQQPQILREQPQTDTYAKNFIITPEEARKTKNTRIIGLSIAGATIATAGGIFALMRGGGSRKIIKILNSMKNYFENKLGNSKIENKGFDTLEKCYVWAIKVINSFMRKSEAVNNFTTFKDLLFKKIMNVTDATGKLHDKITVLFEKIGRQSVKSAYSTTENKVIATQIISQKTTRNILSESAKDLVTINGVTKPKSEWIQQIKNLDTEIQALYDASFNDKALKQRYYSIKQIAESLQKGLSKLKTFFSSDVYQKFIADERILQQKELIQKSVKGKRLKISYTEPEMIKASENSLGRIANLISFKDTDNRKILKQIRSSLKKYMKNPENKEAIKKELLQNINQLRTNVSEANIEKFLKSEDIEKLLTEIKELETTLTTYTPGKMEELLNIYKHLLPEKEYNTVAKTYTDSVKSLDKSIKIETEDFINKLRDLTMGSAPTDLLTIVGSFGILGYHLAKSENNDQRTSIALKYGFPAIAGVGVSLFCNARLFAGTKALLIASVSSFILNRIGLVADDWLKEKKENYRNKQTSTPNA